MSNEDTSIATDEPYVGVSPEYQNHAWDADAPMQSGHERVAALEEKAATWEKDAVVKTQNVGAARTVGIVTDVEGNILDNDKPVDVNFQPVEGEGVPAEPNFTAFVAERDAARAGATSAPEAPAEPEVTTTSRRSRTSDDA